MLTTLLWIWGSLTGALVFLLIYRGTLTMHEDDQLFLSEGEIQMAQDQEKLITRMNRLRPWVRVLGAGSALLIVLIAGVWIYQGMNQGLP